MRWSVQPWCSIWTVMSAGARIVLGGVAPVPWDRPGVARLLEGQRVTPELAARAGELAVEDARPLTKNGYKIALTSALVRRTLLQVASSE